MQFIDGTRLTGSSLSNLVINLAGEIHKYEHHDKKYQTFGNK